MSKLVPRVSSVLMGLSLLAATFAADPTVAQDAAVRLSGVVADEETLVPVADAKITVLGTDLETVSREDGTFSFSSEDVPLGPVTVRVDAPGFPAMVEEVVLSEEAVVFVQFILPSVDAFLDEILVIGRAGAGPILAESRTAADLLAGQVAGVNSNSGIVGLEQAEVRLRGVSSITVNHEPVIYLDGVRMAGGFGEALSLLRQIPASEVRDIQLLRGPASAFLHGSPDGVIQIRTRSGSVRDAGNE